MLSHPDRTHDSLDCRFMPRVLLVGGSFLAAACWDPVVAQLRVLGLEASAVELTGLGRRRAEGSADTGIVVHAGDVADAIAAAGDEVQLVGHSYGGAPALIAAASARSAQVRGVLLLGALLPSPGRSLFDGMHQRSAHYLRELARRNRGWIPVMTDEQLDGWGKHGMTAANRQRFRALTSDHPVGTYEEPAPPDLHRLGPIPHTYVTFTGDRGRPPVKDGRDGWRLRSFNSGHWPMFAAPEALAALIAEEADRCRRT